MAIKKVIGLGRGVIEPKSLGEGEISAESGLSFEQRVVGQH